MRRRSRTILVILDSGAILREARADTRDFFEKLEQTPYLAARKLSVRVVLDVDAARDLHDLAESSFACLVITSNTLMRDDSLIRKWLSEHPHALEQYLANDGGLVVFHQYPRNEADRLGLPFQIARTPRRTDGGDRLTPSITDPSSPILNHPNQIDARALGEDSPARWRGQYPLTWTYLEPLETGPAAPFQAVVEADGRPIILTSRQGRTSSAGRVVISAVPADWAREASLVENMVVFALDGLPEVVVLRSPEQTDAATNLALARLNGIVTMAHVEPDPEGGLETGHMSLKDYLIERAGLCVVAADRTGIDVIEEHGLGDFLRHGGTVAVTEPDNGRPYQELHLYLGSDFGKEVASRLAMALAEYDLPEWVLNPMKFDMRDVSIAAACLEAFPGGGRDFLTADIRRGMLGRAHDWLDEGQASTDSTMAGVMLGLLRVLGTADDLGGTKAREAIRLVTEVQLPPEAAALMLLVTTPTADHADWQPIVEQVETASSMNAAGVARLLDVIRMASIRSELLPDQPLACRLATTIARKLEAEPSDDDDGWVSLTATNSIVSGMSLLRLQGAEQATVAAVLARGATPLMGAFERGLKESTLLERLRLLEALLVLEVAFPIAVHDALQRLIKHGRTTAPEAAMASERPETAALVDELVRTQQRLQASIVREAAMETARDAAVAHVTAAEAAVHEQEKVAAGVGRAAWSVLFVASIVALGLMLYLAAGMVARGAPLSDLAAGVGAIGGAIPLVVAVWWMGRQWRLVPFRAANPVKDHPASSAKTSAAGD